LGRQEREGWGAKVIDRLAGDFGKAFPEMTGLSARNLKYMRAFAKAWGPTEYAATTRLPHTGRVGEDQAVTDKDATMTDDEIVFRAERRPPTLISYAR
jgi:hypothetical protein